MGLGFVVTSSGFMVTEQVVFLSKQDKLFHFQNEYLLSNGFEPKRPNANPAYLCGKQQR